MSKTLKYLLPEGSEERWYAVVDGKLEGPHSGVEMAELLQSGRLSFAAHAWRNSWKDCHVPTHRLLAAVLPKA